MDGRFFGGQKLTAEWYDGVSKYYVEETEEEKQLRDVAWSKWLEGNDEFEENQKKNEGSLSTEIGDNNPTDESESTHENQD